MNQLMKHKDRFQEKRFSALVSVALSGEIPLLILTYK